MHRLLAKNKRIFAAHWSAIDRSAWIIVTNGLNVASLQHLWLQSLKAKIAKMFAKCKHCFESNHARIMANDNNGPNYYYYYWLLSLLHNAAAMAMAASVTRLSCQGKSKSEFRKLNPREWSGVVYNQWDYRSKLRDLQTFIQSLVAAIFVSIGCSLML